EKIPSFESLGAIAATAKMKVEALRGVEKYAVLTDYDWIEAVLPVGNLLTPGIPVRSFDLDEEERALTWLESDETLEEDERIQVEDLGDGIYGFTLDGKVDERGITTLYNTLKNKSKDQKIKLLGTFKEFEGFENTTSFIRSLQVDLVSFRNIDRYALLTDVDWLKQTMRVADWLPLGISMRDFDEDEREKALAWLKGE
ncbi:MAG: STAS/SEC14 domain-containing protein, partial [Bacteroidota bacterium]